MKRFILVTILGLLTLSCNATVRVTVSNAIISYGEETIYNGKANGNITFDNTKIVFRCWVQGEYFHQTYTPVKKLDCEIPTWIVSDGREMYLLSMTKEFISITDSEGIIIMFMLK